MTRLVLRELVARPLRTALTALAIVLGVAMISAALTVGDTMSRGADSLTDASYAGTDAVVTTKAAFKAEFVQDQRKPVPASTLAAVRDVPEVGVAAGDVLDEAKVVDRAGKVVGQGPYFGVGFDARTPGAEKVSPFRLAEGRWAAGAGEVVLDQGTAQKQGYAVGDDVRIAARGPAAEYELVGITRFGSVKSLGTASVAVFDLRTAQTVFGRGDGYDSILVAGRRRPGGGRARRGRPRRSLAAGAERRGAGSLHARRPQELRRDHPDGAAGVRWRGGARGRLHDRQHAVDHRRPAVAGAGAVAGARRPPAPGAALGGR
jgi:putative ABC transport system permease protein